MEEEGGGGGGYTVVKLAECERKPPRLSDSDVWKQMAERAGIKKILFIPL